MAITHADLIRLMEEFQAAPDDMVEILEAWGIDPEGFRDFGVVYLQSSIDDYITKSMGVDEITLTALMCGFILGYKTAMEVETRREVNGNEVQGT